ncbi:MAG: NADH-quinone oxidoreductase subunit NuoF [Caldilineae bacterium]|nr:NADH-quinone oxidoreductase subunit NuoF [Chloroflexota bacterium]MCB9176496.1 NADH-quinone oxidoreductase subunit NuoF [Caldilineae bacterium]
MPEQHVVLRNREIPGLARLDVYVAHGGYAQLKRAVTEMQPAEVIDLVKASGLRGRGGAGFPTGLKWSFVPRDLYPKYIVVNNDESEPGTFKDHEITLENPHQVIEGAAIAAYAVGAETVFIYCRGEFWQEMDVLRAAVAEARAAGHIGPNLHGSGYGVEVQVSPGAGAYICGEETALLSSLEGELGQPRLKPPFPAVAGLYAKPTVVNNTETLANVPAILEHGADWFKSIGTEKSPGTKICCVSGHVERPGNYEIPLGTSWDELLAMAGGVWKGRRLKAVLPAGASAPVLAAEQMPGLALDWESVAATGSILGSASFIVMDETVNMAWVAKKTIAFFKHESCGKCSPCREGTWWLKHLTARIAAGEAGPDDVALVTQVVDQMEGKCFCPLGEFAQSVPRSTIERFAADYAERSAAPAPAAAD